MVFLVYLVVGAIAGVLAGLFGVGGGTIIVAALLLCFKWQGLATGLQAHIAIGTSLACIIVTSAGSTLAHHGTGAVRWQLVWRLVPGLILGVWFGADIAAAMKSTHLQILFGLFVWIMAAQMLLDWQPSAMSEVPGRMGLGIAGSIIGFMAALFGIGGGALIVPFLTACRVRIQEAVATSAACGFPIALGGGLAYVFQGWQHAGLPQYSVGFVYLPALLGISIASFPFTRAGAAMAHRWPAKKLQRFFAVFLLFIGAFLLIDYGYF
jgi:uncharacterized membrane protein YfcA